MKPLVPGLAAIAIASLAMNAILVRSAHQYYGQTSTVRLDPAGLKMYAAARPAGSGGDTAARPVLVFYGDSRAYMWPDPPSAPYRVVNRGISYQTTEQILLRFDEDIAPLHPAVVVVEGGVNDLKAIAQFPGQRAEIVADCESDLRRIVDRCREVGAEVVLVSVFDIGHVPLWRRPFWSPDVEAAVREVNAFLPGLVRDNVVLLDAGSVLLDDAGQIQQAFQLDHLHLTPAAYAALNQKLLPLVAGQPSLVPPAAGRL